MDLKATRLVAVVTNSEQEAERQVNSWLNNFEDLEFTRFELESGRVGFAARGDLKSNIKTVATTIKENDIPIPPHVEVILCPVVHGRMIDVNVNDDDEDVTNADVFIIVIKIHIDHADRKSRHLKSSHHTISYAVFCL